MGKKRTRSKTPAPVAIPECFRHHDVIEILFSSLLRVEDVVALSLCNKQLYLASQRILALRVIRWNATNFAPLKWSRISVSVFESCPQVDKRFVFFLFMRAKGSMNNWMHNMCFDYLIDRNDTASFDVLLEWAAKETTFAPDVVEWQSFWTMANDIVISLTTCTCHRPVNLVILDHVLKWTKRYAHLTKAKYNQFMVNVVRRCFMTLPPKEWMDMEREYIFFPQLKIKELFPTMGGRVEWICTTGLLMLTRSNRQDALLMMEAFFMSAAVAGIDIGPCELLRHAITRDPLPRYVGAPRHPYALSMVTYIAELVSAMDPDPMRPWLHPLAGDERLIYFSQIADGIVQLYLMGVEIAREHDNMSDDLRLYHMAEKVMEICPELGFFVNEMSFVGSKHVIQVSCYYKNEMRKLTLYDKDTCPGEKSLSLVHAERATLYAICVNNLDRVAPRTRPSNYAETHNQ